VIVLFCTKITSFCSQKEGESVEIVVLVECVSARKCGKRVWSAVALESAAMEGTGMFGSAEW